MTNITDNVCLNSPVQTQLDDKCQNALKTTDYA